MARELHDGRKDGLDPLEPLDPARIDSFADLLTAMEKTAFGGRRLGEAFAVTRAMVEDPDCFVVATVSGAMTVAKMGLLFCRLIERGMIDAIVATGALITHGLTESVGLVHYRHVPGMDDAELYRKGYNRVYDTLEMEANLNQVEQVVRRALDALPEGEPLSSESLTREIGRVLARDCPDEAGILKSAFLHEVPIYIPAFTDSEMGLDVATWKYRRTIDRYRDAAVKPEPQALYTELLSQVPDFNPYLDLNSYTRHIVRARRLGVFTVGGGVPRNWAQQVGPYIDFIHTRLGLAVDTPAPRFHYGVRLCPEPVHWGGMSGCTYSEGVSWGKFVPPAEGGRFAEVHADATLVLPLLAQGLLEVVPEPA